MQCAKCVVRVERVFGELFIVDHKRARVVYRRTRYVRTCRRRRKFTLRRRFFCATISLKIHFFHHFIYLLINFYFVLFSLFYRFHFLELSRDYLDCQSPNGELKNDYVSFFFNDTRVVFD